MSIHAMNRRMFVVLGVSLIVAVTFALSGAVAAQQGGATPTNHAAHHQGTPATGDACAEIGEATPGGMPMGMSGATMSTPGAMMGEFDLMYIDMMIPHHASIVAMAEAALPRLTDPRLQEIARAIIDAQSAEIEELRGYRERFYGSPDSMPMDQSMMGMMGQMMPGMGPMDEMMVQMDTAAQVAAICSAADPNVAFIDLAIPHHEMAIVASEAALTRATHQEIRDFAQRVIDAQQAEISQLRAIRAELTGAAAHDGTPAASG